MFGGYEGVRRGIRLELGFSIWNRIWVGYGGGSENLDD